MKKKPSARELARRRGQSTLDRLPGVAPLAGILARANRARLEHAPHPGEDHAWSPWGDWRPPVVKPVLAVRWFHVSRTCERCGETDRRWLEREPAFAEPAPTDADYLRPVPLARYLELAGIELPDPAELYGTGPHPGSTEGSA